MDDGPLLRLIVADLIEGTGQYHDHPIDPVVQDQQVAAAAHDKVGDVPSAQPEDQFSELLHSNGFI